MSISVNDIRFYKATVNSDAAGNGGRISATRITTNVLNNLFPNISSAERTAGVTRYRKAFVRNYNAGDFEFQNVKTWIDVKSTAEDHFQIKAGTDIDVQSGLSGNWYGVGILNAAVGSGETELVVDYDTNSGVVNGMTLYLDDGTNTAEVLVNAAVSWGGNQATISISGEVGVVFDTPGDCVVSSVLDLGDVVASSDSWVEASSSGTYDETTYPVTIYNVGTVTDSWTITFSNSNSFSCAGSNTGSIGSGEITSDFSPANGSSYYFSVDSDGWGGTWAAGETVTFNTVHAGKSIWFKEVVPAGAGSYASNVLTLGWTGESA